MSVKQMDQSQPAGRKPDLSEHYGSIGIDAVSAAALFAARTPKRKPAAEFVPSLD